MIRVQIEFNSPQEAATFLSQMPVVATPITTTAAPVTELPVAVPPVVETPVTAAPDKLTEAQLQSLSQELFRVQNAGKTAEAEAVLKSLGLTSGRHCTPAQFEPLLTALQAIV